MNDSLRVLQMFRDHSAFLEGHFLLSSGLHSPNYMQCAKLLQFPWIAAELGEQLSDQFQHHEKQIDLILSPALGGIIIGHEVARALKVPFLFCEREEKEMKLRRGFQIEKGQKIIVVEDVVTTGRSTKETIAVAERLGGNVAGVGAIVDRSSAPPDFPGTFRALLKLPLVTYPPGDCSLCNQELPLVKPGSRKQ